MYKLNNNRNHHILSDKNSIKQPLGVHKDGNKKDQRSLFALLSRNRSLRGLEEPTRSLNFKEELQIQRNKGNRNEKQKIKGMLESRKQQKKQRNQLKKLIGDEYLLTSNGDKQKKRRGLQKLIQKDSRKELLKNSGRGQKSQKRSYDPNDYNWRKNHSKSQQKNTLVQSPKIIKPFKMTESQYYLTENIKRENHRKQDIEEKPRSRSSRHGRSKSALSQPKVVKNVFGPLTPKVSRNSIKSTKSLFYTFGL